MDVDLQKKDVYKIKNMCKKFLIFFQLNKKKFKLKALKNGFNKII